MIRILYLTCAVGSPGLCEEGVIALHGPAAPAACPVLAQAELAARSREGWRIARWRCEPAHDAPGSRGRRAPDAPFHRLMGGNHEID